MPKHQCLTNERPLSNMRPPLPASTTAMSGRVCVVTGANAGIGKATAMGLAQQGAHVVLACRSVRKGEAACADIRRKVPGAVVDTLALDLESIDSIRGFVKSFRQTSLPLHVLVNNAGIIPGKPELVRGMEKSMVVNHLGPFLLTSLLLPDLRRSASLPSSSSSSSPPASSFSAAATTTTTTTGTKRNSAASPGNTVPVSRIVNVSSRLEKQGRLPGMATPGVPELPEGVGWFQPPPGEHAPFQLYASSKLCNLLFTFELQRRLSAVATTNPTSAINTNTNTATNTATTTATAAPPPTAGAACSPPAAAAAAVPRGSVDTAIGDAAAAAAGGVGAAPPRAISGGVMVCAVTPGMVNTALGNGTVNPWIAWAVAPLKSLLLRGVGKGAETVVWAATSREAEELAAGRGGEEVPFSDAAKDEALAAKVWAASEEASGLEECERCA
eukprot:jgi/Undpi1/3338/HiC_scaffold_15.g06711.m1